MNREASLRTMPDWDAAAYQRLSSPQLTWGRRVLERLDLRGDETVLDAGCGAGRLTAELIERVPRGGVIAVDRSPAMLGEARALLLPRFAGRVRLVHADLVRLPLREAVDVVFSNAVLHWVLDHPRIFRGFAAALRVNGVLEAQCGGGPNLMRVRERVDAMIASPEFAEHFRDFHEPWYFADPELTKLQLEHAGFTHVRVWLEP